MFGEMERHSMMMSLHRFTPFVGQTHFIKSKQTINKPNMEFVVDQQTKHFNAHMKR
jgi:hypothetical protein